MITDLTPVALPAATWGNKAARLSEVSSFGLAVPAGLCVNYATAQQSVGSVRQALATWLNLYGPSSVAVRMSSVHEDRAEAAHAGQTTSVLGCTPNAAVLMRVLEEQILPYAAPWALQEGGLSFIFQCQVKAQFGGVAFLTGEQLVWEATRESTDAITAGRAPDVTAEWIGDDLRASGDITDWPAITISRQLAVVCRRLQKHFGFSIDLEWAWRQGVVYVLQARPVTMPL